MAYSNTDIIKFSQLFKGNDLAFGKTVVLKEADENNPKAESESKLVYSEPTLAEYSRHLSGEISMGIAPLTQESKVWFCAIDIDDYDYNLEDIVAAIALDDLPICPCYSKSGKLHLYIFFSEATEPEEAIKLCKWYTMAFACKDKTELFPKQVKTSSANKFYSWINIPYYAADSDNMRKYAVPGGVLSLSEAVDVMEGKRMTIEAHWKTLKEYKFFSAPPCILTGALLRDIGKGERNNWLFSAGVYLRLKDENCDLYDELSQLNNSLHQPIPDRELKQTIVDSMNRKTYFFLCNDLSRCNKELCHKQENGIDSQNSTGLDYGELTQYMTDPPYYEWIVNGQKLLFWNEQEILGQDKFRALCLRNLHLVPRKVPEAKWSKILTKACENIKVVTDMEVGGDFSPGSVFHDLVVDFFSGRKAANPSQMQLGRVWLDESTKEYVFTSKSLTDYICIKHDFKKYNSVEIRVRMEQWGARKVGQYWRIPVDKVPEKKVEKVEIEFKDGNEQQEYGY